MQCLVRVRYPVPALFVQGQNIVDHAVHCWCAVSGFCHLVVHQMEVDHAVCCSFVSIALVSMVGGEGGKAS